MVEPEVGTAHGEYEPVGLEDLAPAGESHVAQLLGPAKILLKYLVKSRLLIPRIRKSFYSSNFFHQKSRRIRQFQEEKNNFGRPNNENT